MRYASIAAFAATNGSTTKCASGRNDITTATLEAAKQSGADLLPPRSALKGPVLVPRARGFLMRIKK